MQDANNGIGRPSASASETPAQERVQVDVILIEIGH